jgi:hypothetical protein
LLLHNVEAVAIGGSQNIAKIFGDGNNPEKILVWGDNIEGMLGSKSLGRIIFLPTELPVQFPKKVSGFGCGRQTSFFILEDGSLYMCGKNLDFTGGTGVMDSKEGPILFPGKWAIPGNSRFRNRWFFWEKIFFWLFLGRGDENSEFSKLPIEVIFHTLGATCL